MKVGASFNKQEASVRAGNGVVQSEPVQLDLSITGKVATDEADTNGFVAMETAFLTRASLDVMVLDGASTVDGSRGYRFDVKVFKFEEDQGNEQVLFRDFELAPCLSANPVKKAIVTSGAPVFTAL